MALSKNFFLFGFFVMSFCCIMLVFEHHCELSCHFNLLDPKILPSHSRFSVFCHLEFTRGTVCVFLMI